jgi:hypothetical protein
VEVAQTIVKILLCCGFDALVKGWDRFISAGGGYVEKYMLFSQVGISHVLRFISICDLTLPRKKRYARMKRK